MSFGFVNEPKKHAVTFGPCAPSAQLLAYRSADIMPGVNAPRANGTGRAGLFSRRFAASMPGVAAVMVLPGFMPRVELPGGGSGAIALQG